MRYPEDTAPIRADERFDEARVAAYLREHVPEVIGDVRFAQFPGGKANLTYLARAGDLELVLRRPPLGPVAPGSHDMTREHRVLSVLWQAYRRAPRAYHLCTDEEVMGKPFFVMERRHGVVVREDWPADFPAGDAIRRSIAEDLVDALGELHRVDYAAIGLGELGRPDGFVPRQLDGWSQRWELAKTEDLAEMEELSGALRDDIPAPQAATLLHNDFKLDNTMVDYDGRVEAVFDWDMSTLGDPLVDLGTALAYWAHPDDATYLIFGDNAVTLAPYLTRDEVTARYAAGTGFDVSRVDWYLALAYFRITVIIQQIYVRWVRGQTQDERFAALGDLVPVLARAGLAAVGP